jgi:branched-subunit amino acid aminotransferase/4-amino-4-deoxychorismate lyase
MMNAECENMLWARGKLVRDDAPAVSVFDRTFEHGLGLFETFRTWNGRPTLLDRHVARLKASARALGLPLEPAQLPDARAVLDVIEANREALHLGPDARVRITLSGGLSTTPPSGSLLWMTAGPLPPPQREPGVIISRSFEVVADDPLARHKTLNYWRRRIAYADAITAGADEVLCVTHDGLICEASRSNIFLVEAGRLYTPSLEGPLLAGIMRQVVLEKAGQAGVKVEAVALPIERITRADEAFLTNSVRGVIPVAQLMGVDLAAIGPVSRQLWNHVLSWLERGG